MTRAGLFVIGVACGVSAVAPAPARASEFADFLNGKERHDALFVRAALGVGAGGGQTDGGATSVDMYGTGISAGLGVGWNLGDYFGLLGDVWLVTTPSPEVDNFFEAQVGAGPRSCTIAGVGPGIVAYLGRTGLRYELAVAITFGDYETPVLTGGPFNDGAPQKSQSTGAPGFGVRTAFGWDFWIADTSALGIAFNMMMGGLPLEGDSLTFISPGVSLSYLWD